MFPSSLDDAKVLYYTQEDDYGAIKYPNGEIADSYRYLAICKYENDDSYYLFCCNEDYEVVNDALWENVEKCMSIAYSYKENIKWIKVGAIHESPE